MEEPHVSPTPTESNADQRISELENKLAEVNRRYAASSEEGKRLAQTVQQLQQVYAPPRQEVPNRRPWEIKLEESAIPIDAMMQAIDERAEALIQQRFQPLMQGVQARQTMMGRYKDYGKFESDIGEFINSDPEIQQTYNSIFQANPPAAFDWAYMKFGQTKRSRRSESSGNEAREEQAEAQIPTNRNGDARRIPQGYDAAIEEARKAYRDQPNKANAERYARLRLRTVITDEFLNQ